jgi:hypothetical protein
MGLTNGASFAVEVSDSSAFTVSMIKNFFKSSGGGGGGGSVTFYASPASGSTVMGSDTLNGACVSGTTVYVRIQGSSAMSYSCTGSMWSTTFGALAAFPGLATGVPFNVEVSDNGAFTVFNTKNFFKY